MKPLPADLRKKLAVFAKKNGLRKSSELLRISRGTIATALSGHPVQYGTEVVIRTALEQEIDTSNKETSS